jgi:hypothetical protein
MGSLFQLHELKQSSIKKVAKTANIPLTTFRRHFLMWKTLHQPLHYINDETRGRESFLTEEQQKSLFHAVSYKIFNNKFVNDAVF